ncbi:MAG: hypothetical protein AAFR22_06615, partial [Chloroflexota bacterium]
MTSEYQQGDTQPQPFKRQPAARRSGGPGLMLPLVAFLFTVLLALVLVTVALLLPPFNLLERITGVQYAMLDATNNAARTPDQTLTLILSPEDTGEEFGVALNSVGAAEAATEPELVAAMAGLPTNLTLRSPIYTFDTTGVEPNRTTLSVTIPSDVNDLDRLDVYEWNVEEEAWQFVPSQPIDDTTLIVDRGSLPLSMGLFTAASPGAPAVLVPVDVTSVLSSDVANIATIVTPAGIQPTINGDVTGSLAAGIEYNSGYRIMPVIRNFSDPRALDVETVTTIIGNGTLRSEHIQKIATFSGAFNGVFIDYRNIPADQRENYSLFIEELAQAIRARGMTLGVVVPPAQNTSGSWETGAYNWRAIGQHADYVQINFDRVDPTMFATGEDRLVEAMLRWSVGEISRYKIVVGVSARSQRQASGGFEPIGYSEALVPLGDVVIEGELTETGSIIPGEEFTLSMDGLDAEAGTDEVTQTSYIDYLDENGNAITRVWLTTDEALNYRLNRLAGFSLGGVAITDLTQGDFADNVLNAIANYKLALPFQPTRTELTLRWRITGPDGYSAEETTGLNASVEATVDAPEGDYDVDVAVVAESELVRSGVRVALAAPTATPTPLPSPTPTPTSTPTPTPDPEAVRQAQAAATQAAAESVADSSFAPAGSNFGAVAPPSGSIAGGFEYGGHVTNAGSDRAKQAMQSAGMTWMKVQIRYGPGAGTGDAQNAIASARASGFKILLGTVGNPADLQIGGSGYIQGYAQWLGQVAALGPDAIEVWNEPNIDREWPRDQISGAAYADMMRAAYNSIKGTNSSVIVISGAPAPTGAEAAYPGQVVNDDNFLRQFVDAGGLNYTDCIGMHYNEGIVPPDARSGDPRDNYYTRYLGGMLDTYWGVTGGQRPICITELGYLTSAGYPPLPSYFNWASNVTLEQHAAWLAQAAAISSQSGRVRVMIVWN